MIATPEAASPEVHELRRLAFLVGGSTASLLLVGALVSLFENRAPMDLLQAGVLLFFIVIPIGILAMHVLVHRGALWQRLLLAIPTTIVSCWAAHVLGWLLGMSWIAWGLWPRMVVHFELVPR